MKAFRVSSLLTCSAIALALAAAAPTAKADSYSVTGSFPSTSTDFTDLSLSPVAQFNTSLGTLTGVTIELNASGASQTSITQNADVSGTFTFTELSDITLGSTDSSLNTAIGSLGESLSYSNGPITLGAGQTDNLGTVNLTGTPSTKDISSAYFSLFEGPGDLSFDATSSSGYSFIGGGNNQTATITNADIGGITVTYDYSVPPPPSVVPEPGTLVLFGTGLLLMAGLVRRKFHQSR